MSVWLIKSLIEVHSGNHCDLFQASCMREHHPRITMPLYKRTQPRTASLSPFSFQVINFKLPSDPEALQIPGLQFSSESGKRIEKINLPPVSEPWNHNIPVNLVRKKFHSLILWGGEEMQPLKLDSLLCWCKMGQDQGQLHFGFSGRLNRVPKGCLLGEETLGREDV